MIKAITSIESLEAPLRTLIINQSELDGNHVLNALAARGPAMQKPNATLGEEVFESFSRDDTVIIFEVKETDESHSERVDEEDTTTLFTALNLELKLIVYGKSSRTLSQKLKARFESSAIRDVFYSQGLNLQNISNIEDASEYINDVLWQRRDFSLFFGAHLDVSEITAEQVFDNAPDVEVDKAD